jgi:TonB-dependent receptor
MTIFRFLPAFHCVLSIGLLIIGGLLRAQEPVSGSIQGRVLNVDTGDYVYNARVQVVAVNAIRLVRSQIIETYTDDTGNYWLNNVPGGSVTVEAFFTGMPVASVTVLVDADRPVAAEVIRLGEISRPAPAASGNDDVVKLEKFVFSSSREMSGLYLAVNSQRFADNTRSVISVDEMGFTGDGSIGGALKFIPGVDLVDDGTGFANNITLSGAPSSNVPVTIDGFDAVTSSGAVEMSNNEAGGNQNQRAVNLMQMSITSVARVEINRSPTPDSPGKALAGSINLVPKNAFERARPVYRLNVYGMANQEYLTFDKRTGPLSAQTRGIHSGANLSAVVPVAKWFGFSLSLLHSITPKSMERTGRAVTANWNPTTESFRDTPNNPDHYMLYQQQVTDFNSTLERNNINLTADFKLSRNDTISFSYNQSYNEYQSGQRFVRWGIGQRPRSLDIVNSSLTSTQTVAGAPPDSTVLNSTTYNDSFSRNRRFQLKYRHKGRLWNTDLSASLGKSSNDAVDISRGLGFASTMRLDNVQIKFDDIQAWTIGNITANYNGLEINPMNPYSFINAGYFQHTVNGGGTVISSLPYVRFKPSHAADRKNQLNGSVSRHFDLLGSMHTIRIGFDYSDWKRSQSLDPMLGTNSAGFAYNGTDVSFLDILNQNYDRELAGGLGVPFSVDLSKFASLYQDNPDRFVQRSPTADATSAIRADTRFHEEIDAGYLRIDSRFFSNRLLLVYGVRYEHTENDGDGPRYDAGTETWHRLGAHARKTYGTLFPSINARFIILENLVARFSYSKTIGRPDIMNIAPRMTIPADTQEPGTPDEELLHPTFAASNPAINPWMSDNISLSIELYSSKSAEITLRGYRRWVKDGFYTKLEAADTPASLAVLAAYGITKDYLDEHYRGQEPYLKTLKTVDGRVVTSGLELSGRYLMDDILPRWARGITMKFSMTRATFSGDPQTASSFAAQNLYVLPWSIGGGVSLNRKRFSIGINVKWNDIQRLQYIVEDTLGTYEPGTYRYQDANLRMNFDMRFDLTKKFSIFISGQDITGSETRLLQYGPNTPDLLKGYTMRKSEPVWTMGATLKF